jgi:hypothetical protein
MAPGRHRGRPGHADLAELRLTGHRRERPPLEACRNLRLQRGPVPTPVSLPVPVTVVAVVVMAVMMAMVMVAVVAVVVPVVVTVVVVTRLAPAVLARVVLAVARMTGLYLNRLRGRRGGR